jgi:hypothetical protein
MVHQPSSDLLFDMAMRIVRQRNSLRTRTLVAHLNTWSHQTDVAPWIGPELTEMALTRALALLALESESRPRSNVLEQAAWSRRRLAELLAESAAATEAAKEYLATRIKEAHAA